MLRREEIWTLLADLAGAEGLNLFDVEFPVGHRGVLRLYVVPQQQGAGSVGIAECAALSKRVLALTAIEDLLPGECKLEVSSPGVNRRLRRVEHFVGAVGERIRVKYADLDQRNRVIKGVLTQFADNRLEVREEKLDELIIIPFEALSDARVDFLFK